MSGQLRTFAKCWPTQRWQVLRHFADPHFFITVQDPAPVMALDILSPLIEEYGPNKVHLDLRADPDLSEHLTPELARAYHQAPYANAAPAHQLLLQHWYQNEVWQFFQSFLNAEPAESAEKTLPCSASSPPSAFKGSDPFDTIIRLRADLWFHSFEDPLQHQNVRYTEGGYPIGRAVYKREPAKDECFTPGWGEFGGINDRFAILGFRAAKSYFTVFDAIPELLADGCPFHPESLVEAALEAGKVDLHRTLKTYFSTERLDGTRRWPEITPMDMLNASLRAA